MIGIKLFKSKLITNFLIVAFLGLLCLESGFLYGLEREPGKAGEAEAQGIGVLTGKITFEGTKTPVAGAVVKLRNLNNQREFVSRPSDAKGVYTIMDVEEGWYTVGVSTPAGDFNLSYGVYIKAGERASLSMELKQGGGIEGKGLTSKEPFFKTPAGIATIVIAAGGLAFGIYQLTKKEEEASPIR